MQVKRTVPSHPLLQGRPYTPAAQTDVSRTWLRHGWTLPCRKSQELARARLNPLGVPA